MGKVVFVTLTEYHAIMQLEDDDANPADITYEIVPDLLIPTTKRLNRTNLEVSKDCEAADRSLVGVL